MKCGQIEGKDIYLRLMTGEDTENIIRWRNKEMVFRNFIYQKPFTRKGHENWIKTMIDTGRAVQFIICEKASALPAICMAMATAASLPDSSKSPCRRAPRVS